MHSHSTTTWSQEGFVFLCQGWLINCTELSNVSPNFGHTPCEHKRSFRDVWSWFIEDSMDDGQLMRVRHADKVSYPPWVCWAVERILFFVFSSGFARLKDANPERHLAPERCRYARIVTHHVSHVEGFMPTTILSLEVFSTARPVSITATCCQKDDDFGSQPPQEHQGVHPHLL